MKKFLTVFCISVMLNGIAEAQCPAGAFAYLSSDPGCTTGCSVLLLGWPEGSNVNVYGGSPLNVITSTLIDGTLGGGGTGNGYACVPCNQPLVFASSVPNATAGCVIINIGVVAVKLTDFMVDASNVNRRVVSWVSSQEVGPVKYIVQRSSDGNDFKDLATINSQQLASNKYAYADEGLAEGNIYYRLKMVEVSGTITYSKTILVKNDNGFVITTYPNPFQNGFKVSVPSQHLPANIEILDTRGQHVYTSTTNSVVTEINKTLKTGIYIIKVTNNKNSTFTQRLIKN